MALFDIVEEARADGKPSVLNHCIEIQQHSTERFDLRQLSHLGTKPERRQFLKKRRQFLALGWMLTPALEQILSVQQNVHAFGEEQRDHARITYVALFVLAALLSISQTALMQRMHLFDERIGALNRRQRLTVQIIQSASQHLLRRVEKLRLGQVHLDQVGLELLDHFFKRRGDLRDRENARHMCAALEGMQCSLKCIGDWLWQALSAVRQKIYQRGEVSLCLVAKNFQQLWVEPLFRLRCRGGSLLWLWHTALGVWIERLSLGKSVSIGCQAIDIIALLLSLGGKFFDQ